MRMILRLIQRLVERKVRVSVDYLGRLGEISFPGLLKLLLSLPLASHRAKCDSILLHGVRIVATQHEDCASCLQMAVNVALDGGMEPQTVRAVLSRDYPNLPKSLSLVVKFADGVLARDGSEEAARHEIETRFGTTVLAELALAIAGARVFPTVKRGLGFAVSCSSENSEFGFCTSSMRAERVVGGENSSARREPGQATLGPDWDSSSFR